MILTYSITIFCLVQVEERYTQEAVLADQRVTGLKQEAANLHKQLKTTSHQGAMQRYRVLQKNSSVIIIMLYGIPGDMTRTHNTYLNTLYLCVMFAHNS